MSHGFRLRFLMHGPALDSDHETLEIALGERLVVTLRATWPGTRLRDSEDLQIRAHGFATEEVARQQGERLRRAIRKSSVELRTGFDLGRDVPTSACSEGVKRLALELDGCTLLDNVHGLAVYEEDPPVRFFQMRGRGSVSILPARVAGEWQRQYTLDPQLTQREVMALELYSVSLREPFVRARFITLTTIVEVLAERPERSPDAQDLLERLRQDVRVSHLAHSERDSLERCLKELRQISIGAACRKYVRARLGKEAAREFDRLYEVRSLLVHAGAYSQADLAVELEGLHHIVSQLLAKLGSTGP